MIANPEKYEGRSVCVIGYVSLEFEGTAVYLHQDDYKYGNTQNALLLSGIPALKNRTNVDHKYTLIVGTFNGRGHGHMGMFAGELDVTRVGEGWQSTMENLHH